MLRCSGRLLNRLWSYSKQSNKLLPVVVASSRSYADGPIPEGYEEYHLTDDQQVKGLDNSVPLTPEKRAELAAKYNLRPEDYVPMNSQDYNLGDYPQLPVESCLQRDPHYEWDDPFHRTNLGEPIFYDIEMYNPYILDKTPFIYDRSQMWKVLLSFLGTMTVLYTLGHYYKSFLPRAKKQYPEYYPGDDLKSNRYYSFYEEEGLNAKFKKRRQVVNHTFADEPWDASKGP